MLLKTTGILPRLIQRCEGQEIHHSSMYFSVCALLFPVCRMLPYAEGICFWNSPQARYKFLGIFWLLLAVWHQCGPIQLGLWLCLVDSSSRHSLLLFSILFPPLMHNKSSFPISTPVMKLGMDFIVSLQQEEDRQKKLLTPPRYN